MTISEPTASRSLGEALRRLYFVRSGFAVLWAALLLPNAEDPGGWLTLLLFVYPLFDAAAVLWQLRAEPDPQRSSATEWVNVAVSVVVAVALAVASRSSLAAALVVWGAWAIGSGVPQLLTAVRNRRSGGQLPQMLSGAISALAGASFIAQGLDEPGSVAGVGGYALLGAAFFLISAIRLSVLTRRAAA